MALSAPARVLVRQILRELFGYREPADVLARETDLDTLVLVLHTARAQGLEDAARMLERGIAALPPAEQDTKAALIYRTSMLAIAGQFREAAATLRAGPPGAPPCVPLQKGGPVDHRVDMRTGACTCGFYKGPLP